MTYWGILLGLPLLAFGGVYAFAPSAGRAFTNWFENSKAVAIILTIVAWAWTSYEVATFDVNVVREFLGGVQGPFRPVVAALAFAFDHFWMLAPVLAYLTVVWMPKNLPVRALTAILMLFPALMFRTTRLLVPESGFAPVHLFVATAYVAAIVGMYGMFYPWRIEKAFAFVTRSDGFARSVGGLFAILGVSLTITGFLT